MSTRGKQNDGYKLIEEEKGNNLLVEKSMRKKEIDCKKTNEEIKSRQEHLEKAGKEWCRKNRNKKCMKVERNFLLGTAATACIRYELIATLIALGAC